VICCSVQSGCPIGCTFCGTGRKYRRDLREWEILQQIEHVLLDNDIRHTINDCEKFQIMFMSMGEPFMNYYEVRHAIAQLHGYYPNADLLVSTMAPDNREVFKDFLQLSCDIDKVGLQFSVHGSTDHVRDEIIPHKNKMQLRQLRDYGVEWWYRTGRKPYVNYCVDWDFHDIDAKNLMNLFPANVFAFTFSVICNKTESDVMEFNRSWKDVHQDLDGIHAVVKTFQEAGYDTRMFDPAGQDDIGAGCGQLWLVQRMLNGASWDEATTKPFGG